MIDYSGIVRKVYMLVESRLPFRNTKHIEQAPIRWQRLDVEKPLSYFLKTIGPGLDWIRAIYDFPAFDDPHHRYVEACAEHSCDRFLGSPAYLGWKNRKTPGPSLLRLTGPGTSIHKLPPTIVSLSSDKSCAIQSAQASPSCGRLYSKHLGLKGHAVT